MNSELATPPSPATELRPCGASGGQNGRRPDTISANITQSSIRL